VKSNSHQTDATAISDLNHGFGDEIRTLTLEEVDDVAGGSVLRVLGMSFKFGYNLANMLGAEKLGKKIGGAIYDATH
jgi:hypothetical protein